jgi:small-conductance mechanosensitive channel
MTQFTGDPWLAQVGLILGALLLGYLVEKVLVRWLHWLARKTQTRWDDLVVNSIRGMTVVWFAILGIWGAITLQGTTPLLQQIVVRTIPSLLVVSLVIVGMRLAAGAVEQFAKARSDIIPSSTLVTNLARLLVAILGFFIILQNLDVRITPLLTALGVGGLAVALALQDTLGNLFAGVQIILSRQVRPHDYVRLESGEEGYVEDVKSRNTTIRTFPNQNLVIVPNSTLSSSIVTNFSLPRRNLWIQIGVGVSYDSDLEHVEEVTLDVAREVLSSVEGGVASADPKVRYNSFGGTSRSRSPSGRCICSLTPRRTASSVRRRSLRRIADAGPAAAARVRCRFGLICCHPPPHSI